MIFKLSKAVAVVALAAAVALIAVVPAQASNMGFKMNRSLAATGAFPRGQNLVALPFKGPYTTAFDVCSAFGLTATAGALAQQVNATTGAVLTFACNGAPASAFTLIPFVGVRMVGLPTATSGILVGAHKTGQALTLKVTGAFPRGQNDVPVPYHTTAANSADVCTQVGVAVGLVQRINAATGVVQTQNCNTAVPAFTLVLGESVIVSGLAADKSFSPAHF